MNSPELEESFFLTDAARLRRWFPWIRLSEAVVGAFDPRKLFLATVGVVLLIIGETLIPGSLPTGPKPGSSENLPWTWVDRVLAGPWEDLNTSDGWFGWRDSQTLGIVKSSVRFLWIVAVHALCGVAIVRLAALGFVGKGGDLRGAVRFAWAKAPSTIGGTLLPVIGLCVLWLGLCGLGSLYRIPGLGPQVIGLLWGVTIAVGFMMSVLWLGVRLVWPLINCTLAVEGSDAFDGLSRAISYVFGRPWYAAWLVTLAMIMGGLAGTLVDGVLSYGDHLGSHAVSTGAGVDPEVAPTVTLHAWRQIREIVRRGWVHSYFWTAATIIYFLLRRSVDGTPFDVIDLSEPRPNDHLPLVGEPAVKQREASATPTPEPPLDRS